MVPAPAKKAKTESEIKPSSSKSSKKEKDEDKHSWTLDKTRRVKINQFKGRTYVDIREYYEKNGDLLPGKKGISLSTSQWQKLKTLIADIDAAVEES